MTGAQAALKVLAERGANTVFGIPGGSILPLYDALPGSGIRHILAAHEQGAAHMADGFTRAGGKPGVALATGGPGATNLVTGMATAQMDSSPVVFLTANIRSDRIGTDSFQEVDIGGIAMQVTKHNLLIRRAPDAAEGLRFAFRLAAEGRPGPVLCDIAADALSGETDFTPEAPQTPQFPALDEGEIERAVNILRSAERPLILAGGGTRRAAAELAAFAGRIGAMTACTLMGLGCFDPDNSAYLGMAGTYGGEAARLALNMCDLLIAVGCRFSDRTIPGPEVLREDMKILHIDIDRAEIGKNLRADAAVVGDAAAALRTLAESYDAPRRAVPSDIIKNEKPTLRGAFVQALQRAAPDVPLVTDVGLHQTSAARYGRYCYPGHLITSGGTGTMGFGLGAAIGASLARPGTPHLLLTGDGGLMMNCGELSVLAREKLPVTVIVFCDNELGMVRLLQDERYGGRHSQTALNAPDFCRLAKSFGIEAERVETPEQAEKTARRAVNSGKPYLMEVTL